MVSQIIESFTILAIVIVIILAMAYVARRFISIGYEGRSYKKNKKLFVVENKMIDVRTRLVLCRCNGKEYLMTSNQQQVVLLDTYDVEQLKNDVLCDTDEKGVEVK